MVLWPKYLLGGVLNRGGEGIGGEAERGDVGGVRRLGQWPDADTVLQSNMSEGLRDWDLWSVIHAFEACAATKEKQGAFVIQSLAKSVDLERSKSRADISGVFRSVCFGMDRKSDCDTSDQVAWREHVS